MVSHHMALSLSVPSDKSLIYCVVCVCLCHIFPERKSKHIFYEMQCVPAGVYIVAFSSC